MDRREDNQNETKNEQIRQTDGQTDRKKGLTPQITFPLKSVSFQNCSKWKETKVAIERQRKRERERERGERDRQKERWRRV